MAALTCEQRTDAELASQARRGSADALAELYRRHAPMVYAAGRRFVGEPADAEDVLQDVFVALPEALGRYVEAGRFAPWLRRLTVRVALMRLRSRARRSAPVELSWPAVPAHTSVERLAFEATVRSLPESLRVVFLLREVEGYSHAEIEELLGISVRASRVRLHRAWQILKQELA